MISTLIKIMTILFAGLFVIWIFTWAIGWIMRSFMGIPKAQDKKCQL